MPEQQFYTVKLLDKKMIARDIMELRFERPSGFTFVPGQFVRFKVPVESGTVLRPYSISSSLEDEYLEFCAKIIPNGKASSYFSVLQIGQTATISHPHGVFTCKAEHSPIKLFMATGAGMAPVMSMIGGLLRDKKKEIVSLIFGVRYPEDVFWTDRLDNLQEKYNNFSYCLTLSRPTPEWSGLSGYVTDHIPEEEVITDYYICGSAEMVKDARRLLIERQIERERIHFEIF